MRRDGKRGENEESGRRRNEKKKKEVEKVLQCLAEVIEIEKEVGGGGEQAGETICRKETRKRQLNEQ